MRWHHSENWTNWLELCTFWNPTSDLGKAIATIPSSATYSLDYSRRKLITYQIGAPYTTTRLFTMTSLRKQIEFIRSLHTFEILRRQYGRQWRQFTLSRRISWTTAVEMWSHVKTRLHIPRHDFSRWPHSENWPNWLDLYTLLKSDLRPR